MSTSILRAARWLTGLTVVCTLACNTAVPEESSVTTESPVSAAAQTSFWFPSTGASAEIPFLCSSAEATFDNGKPKQHGQIKFDRKNPAPLTVGNSEHLFFVEIWNPQALDIAANPTPAHIKYTVGEIERTLEALYDANRCNDPDSQSFHLVATKRFIEFGAKTNDEKDRLDLIAKRVNQSLDRIQEAKAKFLERHPSAKPPIVYLGIDEAPGATATSPILIERVQKALDTLAASEKRVPGVLLLSRESATGPGWDAWPKEGDAFWKSVDRAATYVLSERYSMTHEQIKSLDLPSLGKELLSLKTRLALRAENLGHGAAHDALANVASKKVGVLLSMAFNAPDGAYGCGVGCKSMATHEKDMTKLFNAALLETSRVGWAPVHSSWIWKSGTDGHFFDTPHSQATVVEHATRLWQNRFAPKKALADQSNLAADPDAPPSRAALVARLYQDELGRGGSAQEWEYWEASKPTFAALQILESPEGRANQVEGLYGRWLRRRASPAELSSAVDALQKGLRFHDLERQVLASPEYLAETGPSDWTLQADAWQAHLYQDVLGRAPNALDGSWSALASSGTSAEQMVESLLSSNEFAAHRIDELYQHYLRGSADEPGIAVYAPHLSTEGQEWVSSRLAGSDGYASLPAIYDVRRWVQNPESLNAWRLPWPSMDTTTGDVLEAEPLPLAPLLQEPNDGSGKVFMIDSGLRRWVTSPAVMSAWGFDGSTIEVVDATTLYASYDEGPSWPDYPALGMTADGSVYVFDGQ